jgi:hypothetical protein
VNGKKICLHCNLEKPLGEYSKYKNRDGTHSYRNVCKECKNKQEKLSRKTHKTTSSVIIEKDDTDINFESEEWYDMFSSKEIEKLKIVADKADDLLKILDMKVKFLKMEDKKRSPRSINIDDEMWVIVKQKSKETNLSYSDIVNSMLKKAIEYID